MTLQELISELDSMAASAVSGVSIDFKRFLDLMQSALAQEFMLFYRALAPGLPPTVTVSGKTYRYDKVVNGPQLAWYLLCVAVQQPAKLQSAFSDAVAQKRFGFDAYMQNLGINQFDPITITAVIALGTAIIAILIKFGPQIYDFVSAHVQDVINFIRPPAADSSGSSTPGGGSSSPTVAPTEPSWTMWEVAAVLGVAVLAFETDVLDDLFEAL